MNKGSFVVWGLAVASVVAAAVCARYLFLREEKLCLETWQIGSVLYLFVDDHKRMPKDLEELFQKGFLIRTADGVILPGPSTRGRSAPILAHKRLPFQYLDSMRIGFSSVRDDGPALQVIRG